ncbi:TrsE protein [Listeria monocytogenes]|uniref:VirB4 family type IV secretion system protein n=1 Tax=Bacilli TaxID=91061 RepID=UPI0004D7301D|nr:MULTISPECIES: TrsE protein [Bacilli]EAD2071549.1 TrsE protein [Listeria monocytogenes]EAD2077764.1 TrsE protein [Listeria monocytogenes]EAD2223007.1 TrsE protein [Listeria monocytogenes]EAD2235247.1 TrsE protein [Listeria monocytogenes]EAD2244901.1 TrsE protein [Listeria monocytogenes]
MEKIPKEKIILIPEVDTDVVSDLAPFNFTVERDKLLIDDSYAVPYVITKYNNKPRGNWFNRIRKMSGDITISHYYTKANGNSLNDYYNRTIKNKQAEIDRSHDPLTIIRLEREMKIAQTQLEQAVDENTSYLYLYTYVLIKSRSEDKLKKLCEDFETRCIASGVKALIPYTMIDKAYWSALPLQSNEVPEYTYTIANSISASSIFPFDDNELSVFTKNMIIEGINKDTENIVSIDYTNRKLVVNRNKFVFGLSGGGKTTYLTSDYLKKYAFSDNSTELKHRIVLFDPEDEQTERVRSLGGEIINLSSMSDVRINPFQIYSRNTIDVNLKESLSDFEEDELVENLEIKHKDLEMTEKDIDKEISKRMNILTPYFLMVDHSLTDSQLSIIKLEAKKCYTNLYEKKNLSKMENTDFPTFSDLESRLKALEETDPKRYKRIEDFIYSLEDFTIGSRTIFNGHTNIDLNNPLICFSLRDLQTEEGIRDLAYLNSFSYLFEEITNNPQIVTSVYADEFHFLLKNKISADFFFQAYKRFRKYNADCTVSTQQIDDVLKATDNIGKAIIGNSFTKVFFGLDETEAQGISNELKLKLTKKELSFITSKRQGEALLFHGTKRAKIRVDLTQEEMRLLNPGGYEDIYGVSPKKEINWLLRSKIQ